MPTLETLLRNLVMPAAAALVVAAAGAPAPPAAGQLHERTPSSASQVDPGAWSPEVSSHPGKAGPPRGVAPGLVLTQAVRDPLAFRRLQMVNEQIRQRGIEQTGVLAAMEAVPRHLFVPPESRRKAYEDEPLPIGWGQTIYQPYIVALMTELLELEGEEKVLEIGTGSGYHTAVLAELAEKVYSIEINEDLGKDARRTLLRLGYQNIEVRIGDGYQGWPSEAPFDAVLLTAAPPRIPQPLIDQLKVGGRMVAPVGGFLQDLLVLTKTADGIDRRVVAPVRVPQMTGEVEER